MPSRYGDWNAVYKCFSKWQEGLFEKVFEELALECDLQDVSIDSTIVKVHKDTGSKKKESIGKSSGGNKTKIHVTTDALGNPVKVILTAGQVHDVTVAASLIVNLKPEIIIADAAYDSDKLRAQISSLGARDCIKPRRNRKILIPFDKEQYKERHIVEFAKRFLAFIHFACILLWLL